MIELWNKFETWLNANNEKAFNDLNPAATDAQILELESVLKLKLPEDFIAFLKVHNGQKGNASGIIHRSELLSTENIILQWQIWNELLGFGEFENKFTERNNGVKGDWWHANWVPFTHDGFGNHLCIDLAPADNGQVGQVITMWHDDAKREVKAVCFKAWFEQFICDKN